MNNKKIALIGCGRIGFILEDDPLRNKPCTHFGGASSVGLKINAAADININRLKKFSAIANININNQFTDYKKLLKKIKPEMVIIATWTESHDKICIEAARNGAELIILEKPIASNLNRSLKLIDECKKSNTKIIINHERRYDSRYQKLKHIINNNKIGDVKTVYASILTSGYNGTSNINEGGGPLLHDGTHLVDMIQFLFGKVISVSGEFQRVNRESGFEDKAIAWLKTNKNIDVFLEAGGNRNYFIFEIVISGTNGKIIIGNGYEQMFLREKSKYYIGFNDLKEVPFPKFKKNNCFQELYKEAKKILSDKETEITSSGNDGYNSLEIIHSIYKSSSLDKKIINLPVKPGSINIKKIFNL